MVSAGGAIIQIHGVVLPVHGVVLPTWCCIRHWMESERFATMRVQFPVSVVNPL